MKPPRGAGGDRPGGGVSYRQLKPHPGSAGGSVAGHQLARIQAATIDLVAEGGYEALTVTGVARAAGVSKRTFYEHFCGKEECFLATYDLIVREVTRGVLAAQGSDADWSGRLRRGLAAFAREIAERPRAAHLALIDVYLDLPGAKDHLRHTAGLLEALIGRTFSLAGDGVKLPPPLYRAIVGACAALGRARLLAGENEDFRDEADELAAWALSLRDPAAEEAFAAPMPPALPLSAPRVDPAPRLRLIEGTPSEREAIIRVAAEIAATEGYTAVTVERIRRKIGLSRARVEPCFPNREECLLAALDERGGLAIAEVRAAFSAEADWPGAVRAGVVALCARLDADPVLSRLALVEVFAAGLAPTRWRASKLLGLAALVRATAPAEQRPTRLQAEASVAGVWAVLAESAQEEAGEDLRALAPGLTYILLAPVLGGTAAVAAIGEGPGRAEGRLSPIPAVLGIGAGWLRPDHGRSEKEPVPGC